MLYARIALRARGFVSALFAPVQQVHISGLRSLSGNGNNLKLGDLLEALVKESSPSHEDRVKRLQVISELQHSLGKASLGPTIDLRILPFGSFVNSLYERNSDLDLVIVGQIVATDDLSPDDKQHPFVKLPLAKLPRDYAVELLRTAVARFAKDGLVDLKSLQPVLHARVPIIKFIHPATGINVDVSVGFEGDAFKTWGLAQLMTVHPAVEKLCRMVKIWARAHGINDPKAFTFNSWCLTLLVVFFLQRNSKPVLLPPLKGLMYDGVVHAEPIERLMRGGRQPANKRFVQLMGCMAKNVAPARGSYGRRIAKPLDRMFLDFLESNSSMLKAALGNKEPLKRGTAISVFYGDFHKDSHFRDYTLFVEDPLNDLDNTARTLRMKKNFNGRTIEYVSEAFTQSAGRLRAHLDPSAPEVPPAAQPAAPQDRSPSPGGSAAAPQLVQPAIANDAGPSAASPTAPCIAATESSAPPSSSSVPSGDGASDAATSSLGAISTAAVGTGPPATAAPAAAADAASEPDAASLTTSSSSSSSASPVLPVSASSLAATAAFLFGTELITRLPQLSAEVLGRELCDWVRAELATGRPAGSVHEELLKKLGAAGSFEPFVSFKKRYRLKILDEDSWKAQELDRLLMGEQAEERARLQRKVPGKSWRRPHKDVLKPRQGRTTGEQQLPGAKDAPELMTQGKERPAKEACASGEKMMGAEAPLAASGASAGPPRKTGPPRRAPSGANGSVNKGPARGPVVAIATGATGR